MPNLANLTGPQDPSQILAYLNALQQSLDGAVTGPLFAYGTVAGNGTGTTEYVLQSYTLPANTLKVGSYIECFASGALANNAHNKTVKVKVFDGTNTITISSGTVTDAAQNWTANLRVCLTALTGASNASYEGAFADTTAGSVRSNGTATLDVTQALVITVTGQTGTASEANNITCQTFMGSLQR